MVVCEMGRGTVVGVVLQYAEKTMFCFKTGCVGTGAMYRQVLAKARKAYGEQVCAW